ncbi:MAG: hypothetical protein K2W82_16165 [Candidatus Obscuribacterales bacterium]|nr:hypothetical protein [Candidatus Obscuribacterales bacterium]
MDPRFFLTNLVLYFAGIIFAIFGTAFFAKRLSSQTSLWLSAGSAIFGAFSIMRYITVGLERGNILGMLFAFLPLYVALGFIIGNTLRSKQSEQDNVLEQKQRKLAAWQRLLAFHQQHNQHALVLAADYKAIGDLERELGHKEEAINAYHQADAIYRKHMNGHPTLAEFYATYAQLLNLMVERPERELRQQANGRQRVRELQELAGNAERAIAELA